MKSNARNKPRRRSDADPVILHALMDGEVHTLGSLASRAEVSSKTVSRAIERLGVKFIIHTFRGGADKGGVYLDTQHIYYGLKRKQG